MNLHEKVYVGLVVDNVDPKRIGRVKVNVQGIYNELPVADIPWAHPFRGGSDRNFEVPAKGKIVNVVFEDGDLYAPSYVYCEHYNINLQNKIKNLSDDDYINFVALLFDHKSQISSGNNNLTIDYLYNQITIEKDGINLNLKNDNQKVHLGDKYASQQAILGNNWFNWFDRFMDTLSQPTSLIGNIGSPIIKTEIDTLIQEYKQIRKTFVSNNVFINDNDAITSKNEKNRDMDTSTIIHDKDVNINKENMIVYPANQQMADSVISDTQKEKQIVEDSNKPQDGDDNTTIENASINIYDKNGNLKYNIPIFSTVNVSHNNVIITVSNTQTITLDFDSSDDAKIAKLDLISNGLQDGDPTSTSVVTNTVVTGTTISNTTPITQKTPVINTNSNDNKGTFIVNMKNYSYEIKYMGPKYWIEVISIDTNKLIYASNTTFSSTINSLIDESKEYIKNGNFPN